VTACYNLCKRKDQIFINWIFQPLMEAVMESIMYNVLSIGIEHLFNSNKTLHQTGVNCKLVTHFSASVFVIFCWFIGLIYLFGFAVDSKWIDCQLRNAMVCYFSRNEAGSRNVGTLWVIHFLLANTVANSLNVIWYSSITNIAFYLRLNCQYANSASVTKITYLFYS